MGRTRQILIALIAGGALVSMAGCSSSSTTNPAERSAAPQGEALPTPSAGAVRGGAQPPPVSAASASAAPAASASAAPAASEPQGDGPVPRVKVANIGMHVGGGPYDNVTKEPIRRSVEPHFDAFRRCFALTEDPQKGGDFGVDLRIERDGGKARVEKPRTAIKGDAFKKCVLGVFEGIDFLKPRGGRLTVVSYSLRFTP